MIGKRNQAGELVIDGVVVTTWLGQPIPPGPEHGHAREEMIGLLQDFIDSHIYNGAPGKGQALYNDGGNPWLHDQVALFVTERLEYPNSRVAVHD